QLCNVVEQMVYPSQVMLAKVCPAGRPWLRPVDLRMSKSYPKKILFCTNDCVTHLSTESARCEAKITGLSPATYGWAIYKFKFLTGGAANTEKIFNEHGRYEFDEWIVVYPVMEKLPPVACSHIHLEAWREEKGAYNIGIFCWQSIATTIKLARGWSDMLLADDMIWAKIASTSLSINTWDHWLMRKVVLCFSYDKTHVCTPL
ncbi:hypothetical protein MKW98_023861, partial [Papaver atlanticum]